MAQKTIKDLSNEIEEIRNTMQQAIAEGANALAVFSKLDILFGNVIDITNRLDVIEEKVNKSRLPGTKNDL